MQQVKGEINYIKNHKGYKGQNNFIAKEVPKNLIHVPILIRAKWNNGEKCSDCVLKTCQDYTQIQMDNDKEFQIYKDYLCDGCKSMFCKICKVCTKCLTKKSVCDTCALHSPRDCITCSDNLKLYKKQLVKTVKKCKNCLNKKCEACERLCEKKFYYGKGEKGRVNDDFCNWLFLHTEKVTAIAHNAKGYDTQFILQWLLVNQRVTSGIKEIRCGSKINMLEYKMCVLSILIILLAAL